MHIELTDHLRCPADHDEAFLVLLSDEMNGRRVVAGHLGCPVCGWTTDWTDEVPILGTPPAVVSGAMSFDAATALTLLGLEGPGGWLALVGRAALLGEEMARLLPGVGLVAVNPPDTVVSSESLSVIRAARWPLKQRALRGVIVATGTGLPTEAMIASVLPGLRAAGEPPLPPAGGYELLAESPAAWVVAAGR